MTTFFQLQLENRKATGINNVLMNTIANIILILSVVGV